LFGKSDPYFEIQRQLAGGFVHVYRSDVIKNTLNPAWKPFTVRIRFPPFHALS
jgi:Ca2+-dependent lipid-binding protein